jgi:cytochrome c-type biogenesis protein CcmH
MLVFAITATLMTLAAMGVVLLALRPRDASAQVALSRRQLNLAVLRQQLDELAVERAQGRLDPVEYAVARDELQRRLLADTADAVDTASAADVADAADIEQVTGGGEASASAPRLFARFPASLQSRLAVLLSPRPFVVVAVALLPIAALALYLAAGSPAMLQAATAAAAPAGGTTEQLQQHVAATPNDARAWVLLARAKLAADHFAEAATAYERAVTLSPKVARDPQIWCEWADAEALRRGTLRGRPLELVARALALDPLYPRALDLAGSAAVEARDYAGARRHWGQLLGQLDPASAEHAQLAAALDKLERLAQPDAPSR